MALTDRAWYRALYARLPRPTKSTTARPRVGRRARLTSDTGRGYETATVEAPPTPEEHWRTLRLDDQTLTTISAKRLVELMIDLSPEVSKALWDLIRFVAPSYEIVAEVRGEPSPTLAGRVEEAIEAITEDHGGLTAVLSQMIIGAFCRGAFVGELVLDEAGRMPVDLVAVDPAVLRWERYNDPVRGWRWRLGQYLQGQFRPIEADTVQYTPLDPFPGQAPYGRPMISPALFSTLFLVSVLRDLKRVIQQQGYPRLDLEVSVAALLESMPDADRADPEKIRQWVEGVIDEVSTAYSQLEPDDAYIHTEAVKVNDPVGAAGSLAGLDDLLRVVERMATRGLKTIPLLMGSNESTTETHANRQWEIFTAGVASLQQGLSRTVSALLTVAAEAMGIQAEVRIEFGQLRDSERLLDAQVEALQIANAAEKFDRGWISQDEAAEEVTGHSADAPEPRATTEAAAALGVVQEMLLRELESGR